MKSYALLVLSGALVLRLCGQSNFDRLLNEMTSLNFFIGNRCFIDDSQDTRVQQYYNYLTLQKYASDSLIYQLMNHENSILKTYALILHFERNLPNQDSIFKKLIESGDSSCVRSCGCVSMYSFNYAIVYHHIYTHVGSNHSAAVIAMMDSTILSLGPQSSAFHMLMDGKQLSAKNDSLLQVLALRRPDYDLLNYLDMFYPEKYKPQLKTAFFSLLKHRFWRKLKPFERKELLERLKKYNDDHISRKVRRYEKKLQV